MKLRHWLIRILAGWGALALVAAVVLMGYWLSWFTPPYSAMLDRASTQDVQFILDLGRLDKQRATRMLHSYASPRSGPGGQDYLNAYGFEITDIDEAELTEAQGWHRGDALPEILDRALGFVGSWQFEVPWFPSEESLRSDDFYAYLWGVCMHGTEVEAVQIIFVRPSTGAVFYFDTNT